MSLINVKTDGGSYDIIIKRGILSKTSDYLDLSRKVMIVTDSGVPSQYSDTLQKQCNEGYIYRFQNGEENKTIATWNGILSELLRLGFTRNDCVVAVGGGIPGDTAGFAAASYMRGIDFYNIPTTCLSQIDSSIGGKTAVNLDGIKNIVGAFYQPKCVLIDADLTKTQSKRQKSNGLAEAVKMALTFDSDLFSLFEKTKDIDTVLDTVIEKSLLIKKSVVEADEKEHGVRRVLNFGHTIGHGIESHDVGAGLYHGECVSLGMLPMCSKDVRPRLCAVLEKLSLPTKCNLNIKAITDAAMHDKKRNKDKITAVYVSEVGKYEFRDIAVSDLENIIKEAWL